MREILSSSNMSSYDFIVNEDNAAYFDFTKPSISSKAILPFLNISDAASPRLSNTTALLSEERASNPSVRKGKRSKSGFSKLSVKGLSKNDCDDSLSSSSVFLMATFCDGGYT